MNCEKIVWLGSVTLELFLWGGLLLAGVGRIGVVIWIVGE